MNDYQVDFGGWIGDGWRKFIANWQALTGFEAIYIVASMGILGPIGAAGGFASVFVAQSRLLPFDPHVSAQLTVMALTILNLAVSLLINAFFLGGLFKGGLEVAAGRPSSLGEMFAASQRFFLPMLAFMGILSLVSLIQLIAGTAIELLLPSFLGGTMASIALAGLAVNILLGLAVGLICVPFVFSGFLIVDRGLPALDAMALSWKAFTRHYITNTLFVIVTIIISVAGILACCLGLFFTAPLSSVILAMMYRGASPHIGEIR